MAPLVTPYEGQLIARFSLLLLFLQPISGPVARGLPCVALCPCKGMLPRVI